MNPSGKSYVCILHEYVQHALKKQPTYKFKELGELNKNNFLISILNAYIHIFIYFLIYLKCLV